MWGLVESQLAGYKSWSWWRWACDPWRADQSTGSSKQHHCAGSWGCCEGGRGWGGEREREMPCDCEFGLISHPCCICFFCLMKDLSLPVLPYSSSSHLAQTKIFLSVFYVCPKLLQVIMRQYHRSDLHPCVTSIPGLLLKFNEVILLSSDTANSDLSICNKMEISMSCALTRWNMRCAHCLQNLFLLTGHLKFKVVEDVCSILFKIRYDYLLCKKIVIQSILRNVCWKWNLGKISSKSFE